MALEYPSDLKYVDSHEYIRIEEDVAVIGITAFAVDQLGDIVFVGLPETGSRLHKGDSFGSVESVKAVEDLYAPLTGEVLAVNQEMVDNPEKIAEDPYGRGWLLKVKLEDPTELDTMMSAESYASLVGG
jgi:glycine cleavage system H protein